MTQTLVHVLPLDLARAADAEYAALHRFTSRLRAEMLPDDPLTPFETAVRAWKNIPSWVTQAVHVAWNDDTSAIVARGHVQYANVEDNRHVAQFSIQVLPEFRRQGIARQLLEPIAAAARGAGRRLLIGETSGRVPAGASFMERLGAAKGLEAHVHQLALDELDRLRVREWVARGAERAPEFELGFWDGAYPDDEIEAAAELYEVMNTQPRGSLELEDSRLTPELLRQVEAGLWARGARRWTQFARRKSDMRLAGFTDVVWSPGAPHVMQQMNTGVRPEFRGMGLARWLKTALLDRVLAELPEVRFIRTGNADDNEAMLRINAELGFKPYTSRIVWQADLERVDAYLGGRS